MCNWKGYKTPFRRLGHICAVKKRVPNRLPIVKRDIPGLIKKVELLLAGFELGT